MPELIVIHKPLHYGGRELAVGARFTATPVDARYLMKRMKAAPAPPAKPVRTVAETRPVEAPAPVEEVPVYRTRRLRAED